MAYTEVTRIQDLITTNLATSKVPKISPADHRPIALGIVNYIDNRALVGNSGVVFAGSKVFTTGRGDDNILVEFGTEVDTTEYVVVGCITATSVGYDKTMKFWMIRDRSTTSFRLLLRQVTGAPVATLTFEYLLFAEDEV